ncbi:DUF1127 domain-containing protein [Pacificoceanicola onchidii]|uniref:DUF1127 domain-containing protein n=1 Tax=Pacificoceanicola onchidii TaxID=2562685 RepID=UPI0010A49113|nr:DUF1127 domain-containing protein [Pacificoceanicola onchidii]
MAHISAPYTTEPATNPFLSLGRRILDAMVAIGEANPRVREIERLTAKSDEDLAKMGLKREDIVRHVMRDALFL